MRRTLCFVFPLHQPPRSLNCGADASESLMAHAHLYACERPRFARGGRGIDFQTRRRAEGGQACFDLQCRHEGGAELSPPWIKSEPKMPRACIQATAPTHSSSPCHPLLLSSPTIPLLLREPIPRPYPKMVPATLNSRSPPCTRPQGPRREPAVPSCTNQAPTQIPSCPPTHTAHSAANPNTANGEPVRPLFLPNSQGAIVSTHSPISPHTTEERGSGTPKGKLDRKRAERPANCCLLYSSASTPEESPICILI